MSKNMAEYSVQPAYNDSFKPISPPSYSEATAPPSFVNPDANKLTYPYQPESNSKMVTPQVSQFQAPVIQPPVIGMPISVGPKGAHLQCPHCHNQVVTKTKSSAQKSAHYAFFFLCLFGCCLCSCIPYCLASFKNVHHFCPTCKGFIGTYRH